MAISVRQDGNKAALDAVLDLIDAGSGDASGDFELLTGANASLAVLPFSTTAFAASTNGSGTSATATSNAITNSGKPTAGTIGNGRFRDKANSAVMSFSISASGGGGDMIVTDPVIPANATAVSCSGVTVTLNITN
jgi:H+/gluconate symporter-like permease